jgi:hypothetical protein
MSYRGRFTMILFAFTVGMICLHLAVVCVIEYSSILSVQLASFLHFSSFVISVVMYFTSLFFLCYQVSLNPHFTIFKSKLISKDSVTSRFLQKLITRQDERHSWNKMPEQQITDFKITRQSSERQNPEDGGDATLDRLLKRKRSRNI